MKVRKINDMNQYEKLIKLEDVLNLKRKEINKLYREHVNPGLEKLLTQFSFDRHFVKAKGTKLWDEQGKSYLDFLGGYGALNFGHNPEFVINAVEKIKDYPAMLQAGLSEFAAALSHNLSLIAPEGLKITYFCSSGAEAVEAALKTARAATGRKNFLYCKNSYHGKTFGALSVTDNKKYKNPFLPVLDKTNSIPFGDLAALEMELETNNYAAFIVEPVQGEAGIIPAPTGYLKGAEELCEKYKTLFIADEIQTGFGRTGKNFACGWENVNPDILTLAKSLGGGIMPVGACMMKQDIWDKSFGGINKCTLHSSTFGANSWAMAAGIASVELLLKENLARRALELGEYFLSSLRKKISTKPLVKDIRGKGLMIGIEFTAPKSLEPYLKEKVASLVAAELLNKYNLLTAFTLNNPDVLRLEPALIVSKEEIDYAVSAISNTLSSPFPLGKIFLKTAFRMVKNFLS